MGYFDELDGWSTAGERDLDELAPLLDADSRLELHRRLVMGGGPSGSSTRHQEAVEVFRAHHGLGQPGAVGTALLLCTCWRWHRCTARLIAGIVATGILDPEQLDELAARLLWPDQVAYPAPAEWFAGALTVTLRDLLEAAADRDPAAGDDALGEDALRDLEADEDQPVEVIADLGDGIQDLDQVVFTIDRSKPVPHERQAPPPLRRWAATHVVSRKPKEVDAVVARARSLGTRDGAAVISGVLDVADALDPDALQRVAEVARRWPQHRVRAQALERLTQLETGQRPQPASAIDRPRLPGL